MAEVTKACNLTKVEIEELIMHHGRNLDDGTEERLERMNYLHKRLKAFSEAPENAPKEAPAEHKNEPTIQQEAPKAQGWT